MGVHLRFLFKLPGGYINVFALFRNIASQSIPAQSALSRGDSHSHSGETTSNTQVKFSDDVSRIEMDDSDIEGNQIVTDPSANWASKNSPYAADDPSPSYSPYLPPVLEEPSSSFSEGQVSDLMSYVIQYFALIINGG